MCVHTYIHIYIYGHVIMARVYSSSSPFPRLTLVFTLLKLSRGFVMKSGVDPSREEDKETLFSLSLYLGLGPW